MKKTLGDLSTEELINTIDLLNQINLDTSTWPIDHADCSGIKHRCYIIRTLCKQYHGAVLTSVERAHANAFLAVLSDE